MVGAARRLEVRSHLPRPPNRRVRGADARARGSEVGPGDVDGAADDAGVTPLREPQPAVAAGDREAGRTHPGEMEMTNPSLIALLVALTAAPALAAAPASAMQPAFESL